MLLDTLNEFSDAQSIIRTTAAGALDSTNVVDLGAEPNSAIGRELYLHIFITTTVVGAGASIEFKLVTDDAADFGDANGKLATIFTTGAKAITGLTAKTNVVTVRVPPTADRYLKVTYTPTGANVTAGAADAFLSPSIEVRHEDVA